MSAAAAPDPIEAVCLVFFFVSCLLISCFPQIIKAAKAHNAKVPVDAKKEREAKIQGDIERVKVCLICIAPSLFSSVHFCSLFFL